MTTGEALYPPIEPYDRREIDVGDGHVLYVEQCGRPGGVPVVFLHGGPGSGCNPGQRRLFDPARFRVVLFDQRGAGRSTPRRSLRANTTDHLVADIERIRTALGVDRWMVVGGSWGAALAVAYAEAFPERVTAIVLRAVFLGSAGEVDWAFTGAAPTFRPELWRAFVELLPAAERGDPIKSYGARLEHPDPAVHRPAAQAWYGYERALAELQPKESGLPASLDGTVGGNDTGPNSPYFEWHYVKHRFFLPPGQLLDNAGSLADIPGIIVQGRYDLLCPPVTACRLAARWPAARLRLVPAAGHDAAEPDIQSALLAAIRDAAAEMA